MRVISPNEQGSALDEHRGRSHAGLHGFLGSERDVDVAGGQSIGGREIVGAHDPQRRLWQALGKPAGDAGHLAGLMRAGARRRDDRRVVSGESRPLDRGRVCGDLSAAARPGRADRQAGGRQRRASAQDAGPIRTLDARPSVSAVCPGHPANSNVSTAPSKKSRRRRPS